jgi:hypothetical protein
MRAQRQRRRTERRQQATPGCNPQPGYAGQGKAGDGRRQGVVTSSSTCMGRLAVITKA